MTDLFTDNGAVFSDCRQYRYWLWRIWDATLPKVAFIGLNPSNADETKRDPTITRVINFAKEWGYGGVYMLNLFAIVSSKPKVLVTCEDPIKDNDKWLIEKVAECDKVIFAWGAFRESKKRCKEVIAMFPNAYCLNKNKDGSPEHPLYVKGDTIPKLFNEDSGTTAERSVATEVK